MPQNALPLVARVALTTMTLTHRSIILWQSKPRSLT